MTGSRTRRRVEIQNLTGHAVIVDDGRSRTVIPPSGPAARLAPPTVRAVERVDTAHGPVHVVDLVPGELLAPLPPARPGRYLLVSAALRAAVGDSRSDLLVVHDRRFDSAGRVTSCGALGRSVYPTDG